MKKNLVGLVIVMCCWSVLAYAQQVTNANFEDWGGEAFDGKEQPRGWHASNVTQYGFKFNFAHKESGHNGGYCMMVQDQDVGAAGITETSPGYVALGQPWVYVESLTKVSEASAGTYGGVSWNWRPDTMAVWIKRTGSHAMDEDFHLLYYSWSGEAQGNKYKGKNGNCTSVSKTNEESDIRQALDGNECGTSVAAHQVSEGWYRTRASINNWTLVKVPIYYFDNTTPEKMNIIFSASNYPNFRANSGLYAGNSLYVDDVQLIYSSKIQVLNIDGSDWRAFDPNSTDVQVYSIGDKNTMPTIKAYRGVGTLTNTKKQKTTFYGRQLQGDEITIKEGVIDKEPTLITVRAEDGSSTTTYQILFVKKASSNAYLAGIQVNEESIENFNPYITSYTVELPYGTTETPHISVITQEDKQTVDFVQPTSLNDVTTITVTAADKKTTQTYTIKYKTALLSDNTLADIKVNGNSIPGFSPTKTLYKVSIPVGTTQMPTVEPVSQYPSGAQTIVQTAPTQIDGGVYQIAVSTPGNPVAKVYKLTFKAEPSSYCLLKSLMLNGEPLQSFDPEWNTYYVNLPLGTSALPEITYVTGDAYQTVDVSYPEGLDGTAKVSVTAGNGTDKMIYKITFTTEKSEICTLNDILLNGVSLDGFDPNKTSYDVQLPIGTTELPDIQFVQGDEYEKVTVLSGGLHGTTRITVSAGNGNTTIYQLNFSVLQATDATLNMIYLDGEPLAGFSPNVLEYNVELPQGATELPVVTYTQHDEYQTVTTRSGGVDGDYKLVIRPQSGASQTYVIHFSVYKSSNTALQMIYLDGQPLFGFDPEVTDYKDTLDISTLPTVTYLAEQGQKVMMLLNDNVQTIKVTAESGATRVYTITFVVRKSESAFLKMIYLDGDSLKGFEPTTLTYSNLYLEKQTCPLITVDKEEGQQVTILSPYAAGTAYIVVMAAAGGQNTYVLQLTDTSTTPIQPIEPEPEYEESEDTSLKNILIDGVGLEGFLSTQHTYTLNLAAGSQFPDVTFIKNVEKQSVVSGQTEKGVYTAYVTAENGKTSTYVVTIHIAQYDNAYLKNLSVEGLTLDFEPTALTYTLSLDEGLSLPKVSYETNPGQTVMLNTIDANHQQLIVTAEDGTQNTYIITYTRVKSANALLKDILLDGVSIADFKANKFEYIDTLAWRTKVVPMVNAIGQNANQIITTYFSSVNNTTRIHVLASDGVTSADYTIHFPVRKSSNVLLNDMYLDTEYMVEPNFNPNQTDYTIELPYTATMSPRLIFEKSEPEQSVTYIARPIGQTNEITVTAENGDTRTYTVTFTRAALDKENTLSAISILETGQGLDLTDKTKRTFDVALPYGTRTMTLTYIKNYNEQTVLIQPGGIDQPTILTIQSNQEGVADAIYTLNPVVSTDNPAVITELTINDVPLAGFSPYNYSYIVPIESKHIVRYKVASGAEINITEQTNKHWQAEVNKDGITTIYDLWFYYSYDVVPNQEFSQWEKAAAATNADKPVGWNTLSQFYDKYKHAVWGTYTVGDEVKKDGTNVVHMKTSYNSFPLGGYVPAYITLGTISAKWSVAGGSDFAIDGGITFRNSPDTMKVNYKAPKISHNNRILYELTGSIGKSTNLYTDASTSSSYKTAVIDLSSTNEQAGEPQFLNIVLNSFESESGSNGLEADEAEMYVDWVRFSFNHALKSMAVNGTEATKSGNTFTYETSDTEDRRLPQLTFVGEVEDQAQQVIWSDETISGQYAVRTATIHNYAENGTDKTDYTLTVNRVLSTINTLSKLYINGTPYADFDAETTEYKFDLKTGDVLPDVYPYPASNRQTITTVRSGNTITITVQPESGEANVYKLIYIYKQSANTQLAGIDGIDNFAPTTYEYTYQGEALPAMNFVKAEDAQTVMMDNGLFTVTAENGAQQTYSVLLQKPEQPTSGQLAELELNGDLLAEFESDKYDYEHALPTLMSFVRQDAQDSVIYTRQPNKMTWHVIGTEEHTYTITALMVKSSSTNLQGIYANNVLIEGFAPQIKDYTIYSDSAMDIVALGENDAQTIQITCENNVYTISVTAEDGTVGTAPYTVTVMPIVSADATLKSILLDGKPLSGFRSDSLQYTIVIPARAYKAHEPMVPSIAYVVTDPKATVEVMTAGINETTYLVVKSSDGTHTNSYELTFMAEPSHNVQLSAIIVNGVMVEHFEPYRSYYSVQVQQTPVVMEWRSEDKFQTVQVTSEGNIYTLHVTAQDGVSTMDYTVEVYEKTLSGDATLSMIWLDGYVMDAYLPDMNPDLYFHSGLNRYTINLPYGDDNMPDISATLKMDGQTMALRYVGQTAYLDVTAPDGVSKNTYTLIFKGVKSTNTDLKMIYLNGDTLANFVPNNRFYYISIPAGVRTLPEIFTVKGEQGQQVSEPVIQQEGTNQRATITVTAEDPDYQSQYVLFFAFQPSDADTLRMLYADDKELENFMPQQFNYSYELPVGTTIFPTISWEMADAMQTLTVDTLQQTQWMRLCQYVVTAESGRRNTYTVTYEILRSDVDTLQMIYLNGSDSLPSFSGYKNDYTILLPSDATERPNIIYTEGDRYQVVSMVDIPAESTDHSLGKTQITVTAQNGQTRVYTLSFQLAYSSDTTLSMIAYNGTNISGFDESDFSYSIRLEYGITQAPVITFVKNNPAQNVDITIVNPLEILLTVLAEDKEHTATYHLSFEEGKSPNALLQAIMCGDTLIAGFAPEQFGYELTVDSLKDVPVMTYVADDSEQIITVDTSYLYNDTLVCGIEYSVMVVAPDGETENAYVITIHIRSNMVVRPEDSDNARLAYIEVKGHIINHEQGFDIDFHPDSLNYYMVYPIGFNPDSFFVQEDLTCVAEDSLAVVQPFSVETVQMATDTAGVDVPVITCIHITVVAPNGRALTYNVYQQLTLDSLNHVTSLIVEDYKGVPREVYDFDKDIYYYEYTLSDTRLNAPAFALEFDNPTSRFACARFERDNESRVVDSDDNTNYATINDETDPTYHISYNAENGTKYMYKIKFRRSEIQRATKPMAGDVLVQHIPGSNQIAVASLRANVVFTLYDTRGYMVETCQLEESNPNSFNTITDGYGQVYFGNVTDVSSCHIVTLQPNVIYFWAFTENGKKKIKSGKLVITH